MKLNLFRTRCQSNYIRKVLQKHRRIDIQDLSDNWQNLFSNEEMDENDIPPRPSKEDILKIASKIDTIRITKMWDKSNKLLELKDFDIRELFKRTN